MNPLISSKNLRAAAALALLFAARDAVHGQTAYGVNDAEILFRFNLANPSVVTEIGPVGFLPEGIDFRPGTGLLYAIDVVPGAAAPGTSQLYTLNTSTGAATPVGAGFPTTVAGSYDLSTSRTFGFDFNPKTLQADNSMRIRLVGSSGVNMRLNSSLGNVAAVDTSLNPGSPLVDGVAYINNVPEMGGTTALYDLDSLGDNLLIQVPPNAGTVAVVGSFGVTVDALPNMSFDISTVAGSVDPTIGGDNGYAVLRRPDAPPGPGPTGAYLLYRVDLATGQILNGALVGPVAAPYDFEGGFAIEVPESSSLTAALVGLSAVTGLVILRRRSAK